MTSHAEAPTDGEVEDLAKLLDGLIDRPMRAVVEPGLRGMRNSLNETRDALGTLIERVDDQAGRLDEIVAGRDQVLARCDAIGKQVSSLSEAQAALGVSLLAAIEDLARHADADRVELRRRSRVSWILMSAIILAAIASMALFEFLRT